MPTPRPRAHVWICDLFISKSATDNKLSKTGTNGGSFHFYVDRIASKSWTSSLYRHFTSQEELRKLAYTPRRTSTAAERRLYIRPLTEWCLLITSTICCTARLINFKMMYTDSDRFINLRAYFWSRSSIRLLLVDNWIWCGSAQIA